jgi:hypothetical protein
VGVRFVFATNKFRFLLVWIDIFAAEQNSLKEVDMVLESKSATTTIVFDRPKKSGTYLSLSIFIGVSLHYSECAEAE